MFSYFHILLLGFSWLSPMIRAACRTDFEIWVPKDEIFNLLNLTLEVQEDNGTKMNMTWPEFDQPEPADPTHYLTGMFSWYHAARPEVPLWFHDGSTGAVEQHLGPTSVRGLDSLMGLGT